MEGFYHRDAFSGCVPCPPGYQSDPINPFNSQTNLRQCASCPRGQLQWRQAQPCVDCPSLGIDCSVADAIVVLPNFYRPPDDDPVPARCPMREACVGGPVAGYQNPEGSCARGYTGPLCGACASGSNVTDGVRYYRGTHACLKCPTNVVAAVVITLAIALIAVGIGIAIFYFLHLSHPLSQQVCLNQTDPKSLQSSCIQRLSKQWHKLTKFLPRRLPHRTAALSKIIVSHLQIMTALARLHNIRWPDLFQGFLEGIEIDLRLELLPYDCMTSKPLTYFERLLLNLVMPVFFIILFIIMNALSVYTRTRRCPNVAELNTPTVWTLSVWTILLFYPSLCRQILETFSCIDLRDASYLADDTTIECNTDSWRASAALSAFGICLYVIGAPVGLWFAAKCYHACIDIRVQRVSLLTMSYKRDAWFFEVIDLIRKLLLASLILLIWPGTQLQICVGAILAGCFVVVLVRLDPYRDTMCGHVQLAAHLQVLFTYVTASAFYIEPLPAYLVARKLAIDWFWTGWTLILVNSICFALLLGFFVTTVNSSVAMRKEAQQSFADQIGLSRVPRPLTVYSDGSQGYHIFISHCWRHAQDVAGTAKHLLRAHYLNLRCFVDVDDLDDIARLEDHVQHADLFVIILTRDYITSKNCRREVAEALRANKPIVVLREMDTNHGAVTLEELKRECERVPADAREIAATVCAASRDEDVALEWHRENHLKLAVMADIMQRVQSMAEPDASNEGSSPRRTSKKKTKDLSNRSSAMEGASSKVDEKEIAVRSDLQLSSLMSMRVRSMSFVQGRAVEAVDAIFLSPLYAQISAVGSKRSVRNELLDRFEEAGVKVFSTRQDGVPVVLALSPGSFDNPQLVQEWTQLFESGDDRTEIIPLYSTDWSFAGYLDACPDRLRDLRFFAPLYQKWPSGHRLQSAAVAFAVKHRAPLPTRISPVSSMKSRFGVRSGIILPSSEVKLAPVTQAGLAEVAVQRRPKWFQVLLPMPLGAAILHEHSLRSEQATEATEAGMTLSELAPAKSPRRVSQGQRIENL